MGGKGGGLQRTGPFFSISFLFNLGNFQTQSGIEVLWVIGTNSGHIGGFYFPF